MVIAVPPENLEELMAICEAESVEATVLGTFTDTHRLRVFYRGEVVADLDMDFLHNGLPRHTKKAVWDPPQHPEPDRGQIGSPPLTEDLCSILASPNVASKEWVIRQYDHEVQGGLVLKPLVGRENDGPGDACITTPVLGYPKRGHRGKWD